MSVTNFNLLRTMSVTNFNLLQTMSVTTFNLLQTVSIENALREEKKRKKWGERV